MDDSKNQASQSMDGQPSCDPTVSRSEFLRRVVKRGALAGALLAAPVIIDRFLIPPAHAMMYTAASQDTIGGA